MIIYIAKTKNYWQLLPTIDLSTGTKELLVGWLQWTLVINMNRNNQKR